MAEANWYYAKGNDEVGPVTAAQLKALAASGELNPDDLLWKEGMGDWKQASDVSGLFPKEDAPPPAESPVVSPPLPAGGPEPPPPPSGMPELTPVVAPEETPRVQARKRGAANLVSGLSALDLHGFGRVAGIPLLLFGLVLVLSAKGCDSFGNRYVGRLSARVELIQSAFEQNWEDRRMNIEDEQRELREKDDRNAHDDARLQDLTTKLNDLNAEMTTERQTLDRGKLRSAKNAAKDASANNAMWACWHEAFFVLGTIVLSVGLLIVGFTGQGAERWICLIMLAIITFSIYVVGIAWIGSVPAWRP